MKNFRAHNLLIFSLLILSLTSGPAISQSRPLLNMTAETAAKIRKAEKLPKLFAEALEEAEKEIEAEIATGIHVPVPQDMAGGYTHERHKRNFFVLQKAGNLFQITGKQKYADYVRDVLFEYARVYPTLGLHPSRSSYSPGKFFWQTLNDANWLVYVSQAYDCIYENLKPEERKTLETKLFRPFANFLSIENPPFFNRVHNHSTWGNAAVGMIALVMKDEELLQRALYGLPKDSLSGKIIDPDMTDNDGGLLQEEGGEAGFFAQLDNAFSPDGYYTEGPYYQRYAISPFMLFARALENNRPDLKIFEYREGLLKKAVYALLQQTDPQGQFFPINDSQKGMSVRSRELVSAVNILYAYCGRDPELLATVKIQKRVEIDACGFEAAEDFEAGKGEGYSRKSVQLRDGKDGTEGALGILRNTGKSGEVCVAFKYTAQGLGHGHYDKLSYSFYDVPGEIVQDYGAARWVNIDQKQGGRYLPENTTWAKQTIAHNTLVINGISHFKGIYKTANKFHSEGWLFDAEADTFRIAGAKDFNAYPGTEMHRTMALLKDDHFQNPLLIDVFRVSSKTENRYELPLWFTGHLLSADFNYVTKDTIGPMGTEHGYEHLREEGRGKSTTGRAQITWFSGGTMYTQTAAVGKEDDLIFARLGAKDPEFNLRREPAFIIRKNGAKEAVYVSVIEPHGKYSPVDEIPYRPYGSVNKVSILTETEDYTAVRIETENGPSWTLVLANQTNDPAAKHTLKLENDSVSWTGPYLITKHKKD